MQYTGRAASHRGESVRWRDCRRGYQPIGINGPTYRLPALELCSHGLILKRWWPTILVAMVLIGLNSQALFAVQIDATSGNSILEEAGPSPFQPTVQTGLETASTEAQATSHQEERSVESTPLRKEPLDPVAPVLIGIVTIILAARLAGHFCETINQPSVLGELAVGVILGNLSLLGMHWLDFLKVDYSQHGVIYFYDPWHCAGVTLDLIARLGVIILLFQVGLESSLTQLRRGGPSATFVAFLGVAAPMALGWGAAAIVLPESHWAVHMFIGAALSATSVGITARVLRDLGKASTKEARIILGAAVIDDVLGLLVLTFAQGVIATTATTAHGGTAEFSSVDVLIVVIKAMAFLGGALVLGPFVVRWLFAAASFLRGKGLLVISSLAFCLAFAWLASRAGLAPIVGAFAAGLLVDNVLYQKLAEKESEGSLEDQIRPIAYLLVPIFFVMMGIQIDLRSFMDPTVLGLAAVLTVAAILGKQACAWGVLEKGVNRRSVGIGMISRGEVGLIFAAIGHQLYIGNERVIDDGTFSALILVVMFTTMVTPPLLKWSLRTRA